jgi:hypothetical protein
MIWLHARPFPLLPSAIVSLSQSLVQLTDRRGGGGGRGAESFDRKKAWPSINRSIQSGKNSEFSAYETVEKKLSFSMGDKILKC